MKWYVYILCFILIVLGGLCAISLYRDVKAESYINGSIDISNKFSQESFDYTSSSLSFYYDASTENTYIFKKELLKVNDFNGKTKKYKVELNDYILFDVNMSSGLVETIFLMDFYNSTGELVCSGILNISIEFLSDKTILMLSTIGEDQSSFFEKYFTNNGIRLKVIEIL